jgi:hypothetical protein
MLAEHKGFVILFVAIFVGCAVYGWKVLHSPARRPAPPIFIEAVPDN